MLFEENCWSNKELQLTNNIGLSSCFVYNGLLLSIFECFSHIFDYYSSQNIQTFALKTSQGCRSERDKRLLRKQSISRLTLGCWRLHAQWWLLEENIARCSFTQFLLIFERKIWSGTLLNWKKNRNDFLKFCLPRKK